MLAMRYFYTGTFCVKTKSLSDILIQKIESRLMNELRTTYVMLQLNKETFLRLNALELVKLIVALRKRTIKPLVRLTLGRFNQNDDFFFLLYCLNTVQ